MTDPETTLKAQLPCAAVTVRTPKEGNLVQITDRVSLEGNQRMGGLLVTHSMYNYGQKVFLKDLTDINRYSKRQNIKSLNYFLTEKSYEFKNKLISTIERELLLFRTIEGDVPFELLNEYHSRIVSYGNSCLLSFAEKQFLGYLKDLKKMSRYIVVSRSDPNNGSVQRDYLKLETRYSKSYQKKIVKRMEWLSYQNRKCCVSLCLTVDPVKYDYDKLKMWLNVKKDLAHFIDKVRRNFIRSGKTMPKYFHTIEAMKKPNSVGNPHIHIVFVACSRLMDWRKIKQYWGKGRIFINRTKDGKKIRNPVMYATKYITKTFTETDADNCLTQSLVWLFNCRSYSCSRDLILPLKPKSTGEWVAEYFAVCNIQDNMLLEFAMIDRCLDSIVLVGGDG